MFVVAIFFYFEVRERGERQIDNIARFERQKEFHVEIWMMKKLVYSYLKDDENKNKK